MESSITSKFIQSLITKRDNERIKLKKEVQDLIDQQKIDYNDAILIFDASGYFNKKSFIIGEGIFNSYEDYISSWEDRGRIISFLDIIDWINESDIENPEEAYKEIYDYAITTDVLYYTYDW